MRVEVRAYEYILDLRCAIALFHLFALTFSKMIESKVCTLLSKMYLLLLSLTINQSFGPARATDQHFSRPLSYIVPSSFGRKAVGNIKKKKVLHNTSQQCHTMG